LVSRDASDVPRAHQDKRTFGLESMRAGAG